MAIAINGNGTITGITAGGLPDASIVDADIAAVAATKLTGTVADARLPTVPVAKGGTGLTAAGASGQVLTSDGTNWASATPAGGGKVLQIVSSTTAAGSGWNTASTSLVDVGAPWTVAITCAATSSKVLVIASLSVTVQDHVNAQADGSVILVRDSTALTNVNNAANFGIEIGAETGGWTRTSNHGTLHILDSPSSTSELVYKLQYACKSGDAIYISYHGQSTITLMEIGA